MSLKSELSGYQVQLTQVTQDDLAMLRAWRNDPNVSQFMLSQDNISQEQQQAWFNKISRDDSQQHFVIRYKNQAIGAANIKAFYQGEVLNNARVIEPGLYIAEPQYRNNILAFAPTLLLNDYCFNDLAVEQLKAVVKADNQAALNYNKKLGYQVVNIHTNEALVEIVLTNQHYQDKAKMLKTFLSRPAKKR